MDTKTKKRAIRKRNRSVGRKRANGQTKTLTSRGHTALSRRLVRLRRRLSTAQRKRFDLTKGGQARDSARIARLEGKILLLSSEISRLEILLDGQSPRAGAGAETARPGTAVGVVDAATGVATEYRLVGDGQPASCSVVSTGTPTGQALLGRSVGSMVTLLEPTGALKRVRVSSVRPITPAVTAVPPPAPSA
jgi:transcription elongation GreA/GreB family factor